MYYLIQNLCPSSHDMGCHGFQISLDERWKELVSKSGIMQENVDHVIKTMGRIWLDRCGFAEIYDPDNCGFDRDKSLPPGPNARPMYETYQIRVTWGPRGTEHITVPGNACGLDIDRDGFGGPLRGANLSPHNIDCWRQKNLLLVVFTWFAEQVVWKGYDPYVGL